MSQQKPYSRVLVSPRLTARYLNENIVVKEAYYNFPGTRVTVCCLTTVNGHEEVGTAVCAELSRFDKATGERIAREKALAALMESERYLLRQRLLDNQQES